MAPERLLITSAKALISGMLPQRHLIEIAMCLMQCASRRVGPEALGVGEEGPVPFYGDFSGIVRRTGHSASDCPPGGNIALLVDQSCFAIVIPHGIAIA